MAEADKAMNVLAVGDGVKFPAAGSAGLAANLFSGGGPYVSANKDGRQLDLPITHVRFWRGNRRLAVRVATAGRDP